MFSVTTKSAGAKSTVRVPSVAGSHFDGAPTAAVNPGVSGFAPGPFAVNNGQVGGERLLGSTYVADDHVAALSVAPIVHSFLVKNDRTVPIRMRRGEVIGLIPITSTNVVLSERDRRKFGRSDAYVVANGYNPAGPGKALASAAAWKEQKTKALGRCPYAILSVLAEPLDIKQSECAVASVALEGTTNLFVHPPDSKTPKAEQLAPGMCVDLGGEDKFMYAWPTTNLGMQKWATLLVRERHETVPHPMDADRQILEEWSVCIHPGQYRDAQSAVLTPDDKDAEEMFVAAAAEEDHPPGTDMMYRAAIQHEARFAKEYLAAHASSSSEGWIDEIGERPLRELVPVREVPIPLGLMRNQATLGTGQWMDVRKRVPVASQCMIVVTLKSTKNARPPRNWGRRAGRPGQVVAMNEDQVYAFMAWALKHPSPAPSAKPNTSKGGGGLGTGVTDAAKDKAAKDKAKAAEDEAKAAEEKAARDKAAQELAEKEAQQKQDEQHMLQLLQDQLTQKKATAQANADAAATEAATVPVDPVKTTTQTPEFSAANMTAAEMVDSWWRAGASDASSLHSKIQSEVDVHNAGGTRPSLKSAKAFRGEMSSLQAVYREEVGRQTAKFVGMLESGADTTAVMDQAKNVVISVSKASGGLRPGEHRPMGVQPGRFDKDDPHSYVSAPLAERALDADAPTLMPWLRAQLG